MGRPELPLSPFLNYRWGVTNTLSIVHRLTGITLSLGVLVLAGWLISIAIGPDFYAGSARFFGSTLFKLPLAGWVFCFFFHLANGVRHLIWDAGFGFETAEIKVGGISVVVFAVVATAVYAWIGLV